MYEPSEGFVFFVYLAQSIGFHPSVLLFLFGAHRYVRNGGKRGFAISSQTSMVAVLRCFAGTTGAAAESRGVSLVEVTSDSPWKKGQRKTLAFVTNILCNFQIIDITIWRTNNSTNTPHSSIQQEIWQSWQIHLSWPVPLLIMIICKFPPCLGQRASDPCRKGTRLCHLAVAFQAMPPK